ncbi:uncharacterized protein LOC104581657 [Brachypodium distachyon]|uniref:Uncharacterized protein n=1 Tax=Brachypodium distachyon TaxID=15368 RepID=I1H1C5_BRADI|nr:uncharacterized protein LOC104581657 [Brachypodium distachyon]KQK19751.1 hypothetical protein BRADI_1g50245v3 [Brachypodium distachyon]|eukprot:XP_010228069.1 uncharacterized protein LOC104581657 [Brachypodium distachyon]
MDWCGGVSGAEGEAGKIAPPLLLLLLVLLLAAGRADAWGKEGHIMVCKTAERYLTEKMMAAVKISCATAAEDLVPSKSHIQLPRLFSCSSSSHYLHHSASDT